MEVLFRRKIIDWPVEVLDVLAAMARKSGTTLKSYMESVLASKAAESNPSPSGDAWFDDKENIRMVKHGISQLENGEGRIYKAEEIKAFLGV